MTKHCIFVKHITVNFEIEIIRMFEHLDDKTNIATSFNDLRCQLKNKLEAIGIEILYLDELDYFCFALYSIFYVRNASHYYSMNLVLLQLCEKYRFAQALPRIKLRVQYYTHYIQQCLSCQPILTIDATTQLGIHLTDCISNGINPKQTNIFILSKVVREILDLYQTEILLK